MTDKEQQNLAEESASGIIDTLSGARLRRAFSSISAPRICASLPVMPARWTRSRRSISNSS
jgi:hypothetical protein